MAKLTDTQLIILSSAAARTDGIAVVPPETNKTAASKVGASLVTRKLMRELRSKPGMPVWRQDENGRSISLMITRAGRDAIGVDEGEKEATQASRSDRKSGSRSPSHRQGDDAKSSASTPLSSGDEERSGNEGRRARDHCLRALSSERGTDEANDLRSRPIALPTMLCSEGRSKLAGSRWGRCAKILHRREPASTLEITSSVALMTRSGCDNWM